MKVKTRVLQIPNPFQIWTLVMLPTSPLTLTLVTAMIIDNYSRLCVTMLSA